MFQLRKLSKLIHMLLNKDLDTVLHAFISTGLDYCNALYLGISESLVARLQYVQNAAASLPDELNTFYARFEADNTAHTESAAAAAAEEVSPLTLSVADVTRSFKRVNIRKAVGPDGIPGRVLKACAFQLAGVFTDIFNLSLSLSVVPACFKKSTIIVPIPKKNKITCLNDWRPVALTPIFSKCFEKLVREHICSVLPASLDPLQFAASDPALAD